jgi:hypothetical protein
MLSNTYIPCTRPLIGLSCLQGSPIRPSAESRRSYPTPAATVTSLPLWVSVESPGTAVLVSRFCSQPMYDETCCVGGPPHMTEPHSAPTLFISGWHLITVLRSRWHFLKISWRHQAPVVIVLSCTQHTVAPGVVNLARCWLHLAELFQEHPKVGELSLNRLKTSEEPRCRAEPVTVVKVIMGNHNDAQPVTETQRKPNAAYVCRTWYYFRRPAYFIPASRQVCFRSCRHPM